jgi:hypothetical protein
MGECSYNSTILDLCTRWVVSFSQGSEWPKLRHCIRICLEGLSKTTKTSVRISDLRTKARTWDFPNMKWDRNHCAATPLVKHLKKKPPLVPLLFWINDLKSNCTAGGHRRSDPPWMVQVRKDKGGGNTTNTPFCLSLLYRLHASSANWRSERM